MDTIKIDKKRTKLVAHRGLSGIEKENTNSAFVAAGNRSYYGIETDIHRTGDGRFVVCHDDNLNRVAGEDVFVEKESLSKVQSVVLFDKDGSKNRQDLRASVLENYLDICKKYSKQAVLELKSDFTDKEIEKIIEIVKSFDYLENVTFISFIYSNLTKIRKICPNQSVQFLFMEINEQIIEDVVKDKIDVDAYYKNLTKETIDLLHERGIIVNCWTVDDSKMAEQLIEWGVDYITTNILE